MQRGTGQVERFRKGDMSLSEQRDLSRAPIGRALPLSS